MSKPHFEKNEGAMIIQYVIPRHDSQFLLYFFAVHYLEQLLLPQILELFLFPKALITPVCFENIICRVLTRIYKPENQL